MVLPAWVAWTVQVPVATSVTVVPETVHTGVVCELKLTARPELAVALTVNGTLPASVRFAIAPKVMVWLLGVTWKLWLTGVAAAQLALPACVAWRGQVPTETSGTVLPETVHTGVVCELKLTAKPELAVARTVNAAEPYARFASAAKVMVWLPCVTWKLWLTAVAAAYVALPAWVAWIVQVPTATSVTVVPETLHTAVVCELKATVRPELAVAPTVDGAVPST